MITVTTSRRPRVDRPTLAGLLVVGLAAAVLSFASLTALGQRAGYPASLAVLLPVAIDAQAAVAARAWLAPSTPDRARRYARSLALAAVAVSIVGNAGEHALAAYVVTVPWWVVVAVSAIPPAALAATAHLAALVTPTAVAAGPSGVNQADDQHESTPTTPGSISDESGPTLREESTPTTRADVDGLGSTVEAPTGSVGVDASSASTLDASTPTTTTSTAGSSRSRSVRSMPQLRQELTEAVATGAVDPTSANSIRTVLACSAARARQLRDEHATTPAPRLALVGQEESR